MRHLRRQILALIVLTGAIAGPAAAQTAGYSPAYLEGSAWDRLSPIDPGSGDLGPLGLQTRVLPAPMRDDRDFGLLYRTFSPDGTPVFARRDGGITALFPRSAYAQSAVGSVALIPPGTRFIIGEPAAAFSDSIGLSPEMESTRDPSAGLRLDGRLGTQLDATIDEARPWRTGENASPRRGIGALLRRAGENERALKND